MHALPECDRLSYEMIAADGDSTDGMPAIAEALDARLVREGGVAMQARSKPASPKARSD
jgi:hypothetical protein